MSADWLFVTFVIPAVAIAVAYVAMRANEWSIQRDERKSGK
ncbi:MULTISPECIES: hypothetical protein [unclassified Methylobacterium]|jgi:hypothetical protein|nr:MULTISPECIES: hypothetical protein [unclassified Methylobacterium]